MSNKPFCILSIDGGGLKGLIAIKLLQIIEEVTNIKVTQLFNLIGGTSTGGLIASAMTVAKSDGTCVHELSFVEAMYLEAIQSLMQNGVASGKETEKLNELIRRTVGGAKIADTCIPVFVPTYDSLSNRIVVFKTRSALLNESKNIKLFDVCRATSAVPSIFPSYPLRYNGKQLHCVDAGWHIKNPAVAVLAEFWKHKAAYSHSDAKEEDIFLLSISTGSFNNSKNDWTTRIEDILPTQYIATDYIGEQGLEIDLKKVRFMRIDLQLGNAGYSLKTLMEVGDKIESLSKNKQFARDLIHLSS